MPKNLTKQLNSLTTEKVVDMYYMMEGYLMEKKKVSLEKLVITDGPLW